MIELLNNLSKKKSLNVFITGGTSGIGYKTVLKLITLGHNIVLPCRNYYRANQTLTRIFNDLP